MRGNAAVQGVPIVLVSKLDAAEGATASAVVSAVAGVSHVLVTVEVSYTGAAGAGELSIRSGPLSEVVHKQVTVTGPGHWTWDFSDVGPVGGIPIPMGDAFTVRLTGVASATAKVNATYR
jgi:hypothetical protein